MSNRPLTTPEKVFEDLNVYADRIFEAYGEVRGIAFVIDWEIGQNDFPAGIYRARNTPITHKDLAQALKQSCKMVDVLSSSIGDALNAKQLELLKLQKSLEVTSNDKDTEAK